MSVPELLSDVATVGIAAVGIDEADVDSAMCAVSTLLAQGGEAMEKPLLNALLTLSRDPDRVSQLLTNLCSEANFGNAKQEFPTPPPFLAEDPAVLQPVLSAVEEAATPLIASTTRDCAFWCKVFATLQAGGIARLEKCRFTVGTRTAVVERGHLPLSLDEQRRAFHALHCATAKLSVGARALSKHIGRDTTVRYWGLQLNGSEESKNAQASLVIEKILANAVWSNVHMLPHDIVAFELRVAEGYGARWTRSESDDLVVFRGFLEPQDPSGHANGWIH